jgi:hypothetical protein
MYGGNVTVFPEIYIQHINTLCGQNVEILNVKPGRTEGNQWAAKGYASYMNQNFLMFTLCSHEKGLYEMLLLRTYSWKSFG